MLPGVLLEGGDVVLAGVERTVAVIQGSPEVDSLELADGDVRGVPSSSLNTAVEEVDVAVGTTGSSDLG